MSNKLFSERLNTGLDRIGVPELSADRINALAKLMKIPKFKAEALLHGMISPDPELLSRLAAELEVTEAWLIGKE